MNHANHSFLSLAQEYLRRRRATGKYPIEQFADEFPEHREAILEQFPVILIAESLKGDSSPLELPKTLGRYVVGEEIGRGAMGIVVTATNPGLDSEVAIKMLPFERISSIEMLQRFHTEAKICATMDHPNIVPVFDYGTDEKFAFLVMKRIHGRSLDKVTTSLAVDPFTFDSEGFQLDWELITSIGIQAADALHYAHEHDVIHRDIKPANLILEEDGRLWVSDFGLSKFLGNDVNLSMTGDILGTPRYMAPEQLRGVYDACSDVYSLGMTLYELVAVQPVGDIIESSTQIIVSKTKTALPDLQTLNPAAPAGLCEIIMRAVALDPEERYASAQELCNALTQSENGTFIGDRRRKKRQLKQRKLATFALACGVGVVSWAGMHFFGPAPEKDLSDILDNPANVRRILDQEDSKAAILESLPNLVQTAFETEDKDLRALVADLAVDLTSENLINSDHVTEKQKIEYLSKIRRLGDAFIENGFRENGIGAEAKRLRELDTFLGAVFEKRLRGLLADSQLALMPEPLKTNASLQIDRFFDAKKKRMLSESQQIKIAQTLASLLEMEGDSNGNLRLESLQFFIRFLEMEMDRIESLKE